MTFIPPLLGILMFTFIVKFSGSSEVASRLPMYQGVTSYFSLILIGFTYIKDRYAIRGRTMAYFCMMVVLLPFIIYGFLYKNILLIAVLIVLTFSSSIILYLLLLKKNVLSYLIYSIFHSVILPLFLILNVWLILGIVIILLLYTRYLYSQIEDLQLFTLKNQVISVLTSILLHSPFISLPFFDYFIQLSIGDERYSQYVLLQKYINGAITLLFSYTQMKLMFSGNLQKVRLISWVLCVTLLLSFFGLWYQHTVWIYGFMIGLCSLGVNFSSLLIRSKLIQGIGLKYGFVGLFFVLVYVFCIKFFSVEISENANVFIFFMTIFTVIPGLFMVFIKYKSHD